jgi:hypothetical protein
MTRRRSISLAVVVALASLLLLLQVTSVAAKGPKILKFGTMVGVTGSFVGSANPLRGVNGGGLPWRLNEAGGQLTAGGHLDIEVEGLVLAAGASEGTNPIPNFRGLVSCLNTSNEVVNRLTDNFPATTGAASAGGGNAHIEADLAIPDPCIAPIVFVTSPTGSWFSVTGG